MQQEFAELRDTWQSSVAKWSQFAQEAPGGMPSGDALRAMFSPASWSGSGAGALGAALQQMVEGPRFAALSDLDRQLLELQKLTLQRDEEMAGYQAVVRKGWELVFERFVAGLGNKPHAGMPTWRELADRWLAVAGDTLIEVRRSDEFLEAQRRMLRAASDRHLQERRIAEAWCQAAHVPTRGEVDELQRQVVELRRELRSLRRAVVAASSPATKTRPARRATTKRVRL
jgi:hypothetical protein